MSSTFEDYGSHDALGLADLVRRGEVTPTELVEAAIARIDRVNPKINAVITRMDARAREAAQGDLPAGPFRGVPFLAKDLVTRVKGVRFTQGSRFWASYVPDHDSELARRWRAAGLVLVGKTNTPELGITPVTEPALHGPTHTPWRVGLTSGGSSGGSAAAVAAGIVPMAHGGDGGGSIRIPAACCGCFGLKPSRGRSPLGPDASELWRGFAVEHVLTRSVRDSAAMLDATCAPEPGAAHVAPRPERPFLDEVGVDPGRLRIAFTTRPHLPGSVHPECVAAVQDAARLCEELGHEVEEAAPETDQGRFAADFLTIVAVETAADIEEAEAIIGRRATRHDFETSTWLLRMMGRQLSAPTAAAAHKRLQRLAREVGQFFERWDVLLTPTTGAPPVRHYELQPKGAEALLQEAVAAANLSPLMRIPGVIEQMAGRVFEFVPFTPLANVTGQPSMSVPLLWRDGLPLGSTFTARFGEEATLLRLAAQLEQARPWKDRRPPIHAFDL